jgi:hypothetical protein
MYLEGPTLSCGGLAQIKNYEVLAPRKSTCCGERAKATIWRNRHGMEKTSHQLLHFSMIID